MRTSGNNIAAAAVGGCLLLLIARAPLASAEAEPGPGVTPAGWEQWQPEQDRSDPRLEQRVVSIWEGDVAVSDVLSEICECSSVRLAADLELLSARISIFVEERSVGDVMVALDRLLDGHWCYPTGSAPTARLYHLTEAEPITEPIGEWLARRSREARRTVHAARREVRAHRLAEHQVALGLSPEEVLAQYEESDPWLCAKVLDPAFRPILEYLGGLDEEAEETLFSEDRMVRRLSALPSALGEHLQEWSGDARGGAAGWSRYSQNPDRLLRFATQEERWRNAYVSFSWWHHGLHVLVHLPDTGLFQADVLRMGNDPPRQARLRLVRLGFREDTPEYRAFAEEDARRWREANDYEASCRVEELLEMAAFAPDPTRTDLRLKDPVNLAGKARYRAEELLEMVAQQLGIAVLAYRPAMPPSILFSQEREGEAAEIPLGEVLEAIRSRQGTGSYWKFQGQYLLVGNTLHRAHRARLLSDGALSEYRQKIGCGKPVSFEEVARFLASLNELQLGALEDSFPELFHLHTFGLQQYGLLTDAERQSLAPPEGLAFGDLRPEQRRLVLAVAQRPRPWVQEANLANTVLRAIPRALASGQEGMSFVFEHGFPDAPGDRDVLFTTPLWITIPRGAS